MKRDILSSVSVGEAVRIGNFYGNITRLWRMGTVPCVQIRECADDGHCYLTGERKGRSKVFRGTKQVTRLLECMGTEVAI